MTVRANSLKALGLGAALALVSAGAAFADVALGDTAIRSGPGTGYRVVGDLSAGEYVDVVRVAGRWCLIDDPVPSGWVRCAALGQDYVYGPQYVYPDYGFQFYYGGGNGFPFHGYPPPHGHFPPPHGGGGGMPPPHGGGGMPPPHGGGGMPPPHGGGGMGGPGDFWWFPHH